MKIYDSYFIVNCLINFHFIFLYLAYPTSKVGGITNIHRPIYVVNIKVKS